MDNKIKASELPGTEVLTQADVEELLPELDALISWAKGVQDYALQEALKGVKYAGYKVVEGRATQSFTDELKVVKLCVDDGTPEAMLYKPRELVSVSGLEKILGRAKFKNLISPYISRGVGKPALVEETDKRPEFKLVSAAEDFKEELK